MIPDIPPIVFYLPFFVLAGAALVLAGTGLLLLAYLETLPSLAKVEQKEPVADE
jgi:hypothetical protein